MLRQIRNVEPFPGENVTLPERVDVAPVRGVEPLVDLDVHLEVDLLETGIACSEHPRIHGAFNREHPVGLMKLEPDAGGFRKGEALERFDGHLVFHNHELAAAGEQPADVNPVRTIHRSNDAAARGPAN